MPPKRFAAAPMPVTVARTSLLQLPFVLLNEASFLNFSKHLSEVGQRAVWRVSTAKHGNGVAELRDGDPTTYWQSDGAQPHSISIEFFHLTPVTHVALHLDFDSDDSYTPRKFTVRSGTYPGDTSDVVTCELHNPNGWVVVPLVGDALDVYPHRPYTSQVLSGQPQSPIATMIGIEGSQGPCDLVHSFTQTSTAGGEAPRRGAPMPLMATLVTIRITENHQNGRDCHIRGAKIFGPQRGAIYSAHDHESFVRLR